MQNDSVGISRICERIGSYTKNMRNKAIPVLNTLNGRKVEYLGEL